MRRRQSERATPTRWVVWALIAALSFGPAAPVPGSPRGAGWSSLDPAPSLAPGSASQGLKGLPLYFIHNQGQVDERVAYYVHGATTSVYLTRDAIVFALKAESASADGWSVHLAFENPSPHARLVGRDRADAVVSYLKGRPSEWKTGLSTYTSVVYEELWPGIDLVYESEGGRLKYTFVVAPGADPDQIRLRYRGASAVRLTEAGRLSVSTPAGGFEEDAPVSWQEHEAGRRPVASSFQPEPDQGDGGFRFGFRLGAYDPTLPLVIDPIVLSYCGYLGGTAGGNGDEGFGIAVDAAGAAYVVGSTTSADFPFSVGAFDTTHAGNRDAFVAKVNAAGTGLVYATFIGGTLDDIARAVAVDGSGNAYVAGETASSEGVGWPVLMGPDLTYAGNTDGFVLKLNAAGNALVYSGFIGGSGTDRARAIAVDAAGAAYVGGTTTSDALTFPETAGAYDVTLNNQDGFVAKISVAGGAFTYCSYLGNNGAETLQAIAVDAAGSAYVAGYTDNTTVFPTTGGAYDTTANGGNDAFVTKFNAAGSALVYSTLLGGSALDNAIALALDSTGNAYVAGQTTSSDFPRTSLQTWSGGNDGFVTKLNTTGTALVYSGLIGGTGFDAVSGIAVDASGSAYLAGNTDSTQAQGFPVVGTLDPTYNGGFSDAFVARVSAAGTALVFCAYLGGSGDEQGGAIALDSAGGAYLTGTTTSTEATFPETVGPDLTQNGGGSNDAFVAKVQTSLEIYYSVGTQAAALYSGNASAASGTLTLASAAPSNVGVGDEIRLGANRYYITGRSSATVFSIQDSAAAGGTPGATGISFASSAITIFRAFNLLSTAEANSSNASHLNTANLAAAGFQLNWPCYNDSPMDNRVDISGYTTNAATYIRVFTPVAASQVGASQRHTGRARTGFRLRPTSAVDNDTIRVNDSYVRIEGIEIDGSLSAAPNGAGGVSLETFAATPVDHYVSHNLIYDTRNFTGIYAASMSAKVWNNVLHNVDNTTLGAMVMAQAGGTGYFYNNTVYDHAGHGIRRTNGTMIATNNVSMLPGGGFQDFNGAITQSYNVSSDATASCGATCATGMTSYATYFQSTTPSAEDLHLRATSLALWARNGTSLAADPNLPVTNDIDLGARARPDIGADEFTPRPLYRSVGTTATALATGAANALTISGSTATFAGPLPANIGVGDVIQYDSDGNSSIDALAFIHGRSSSQSYAVRNKDGAPPTPVVGDNNWGIYRAYTSLANWESQNENGNILEPVENDVNPSPNLVTAGSIMLVACYADGADAGPVVINGWTTAADTYISIFTPYRASEVGVSQRHSGVWDATKYRLVGAQTFNGLLRIQAAYVRVSGLQVENTASQASRSAGIEGDPPTATSEIRISHNILRATGAGVGDFWAAAVVQTLPGGTLKVWNNIMYDWGAGIFCEYATGGSSDVAIYNNTVINSDNVGIDLGGHPSGTYRLANNIVQDASGFNYFFGAGVLPLTYSASNLSSDATSPNGAAFQNKTATYLGAADFHLGPADVNARNLGTDLSADPVLAVLDDVDGQQRQAPWDIGADDASGTTAVKLMSFVAVPADAAVSVEWRTGSELDNLGFHLYRALSADGPWTRLTASLVAGLGSSAVGRAYSFRDSGLVNGTRYFYRLEDVDASSKVTSHGPVSAVPVAGAEGEGDPPTSDPRARDKRGASTSCPDWVVAEYGSLGGGSPAAALRCTRHGDPEAVSLGVVSRDSRQTTLELRTGGFYALHEDSGRVRVFVPGFDTPQDPHAPALPFRRVLVDAVVGRRAQLGRVRGLESAAFRGLVPASLGEAEMQVALDGTVRAGRRAARESSPRRVSLDLARLMPSVFQGEAKSAVVEIAPLRYDAARRQLVLAKRVLLTLLFTGREAGESGRGRLGRRARPQKPLAGELLARLHTTSRGLHAVSFEQLFPGRQRGLLASQLRLDRQGHAQAFHLAPDSEAFGPGGTLYFHADSAASSDAFSAETAWELWRAPGGVRMPLVPARPSGAVLTSAAAAEAGFETNRFYQPGLLLAQDLWLWEALASGNTRAKGFALGGVDAADTRPAELEVFLQGASESGSPVDHHVSVSVNGVLVGEAQFAGKKPYRVSLSVPASVLRDGANELSLTNVADTGVSSLVFLDRFTLSYPRASALVSGAFEGTWAESGIATVAGPSAAVAVLDVTASSGSTGASWLQGHESAGGALRFRAEAGRRYQVVSREALLTPRVGVPAASSLRAATNQADYLLIAPRAFLAAAEPLVERRRGQGLAARAITFEEIVDEFGHGQPSAEAIRGFLSFAFQSWARPSPRYVLLVGDASYDPRNFTGSSQPSPLPALWAKTSYLWTASDPQLAAVNGEDGLPDLAIGRLPATTVEQAEALVAKLIAWEDSGQGLSGTAALVADNPDIAGDFEADVRDVAHSYFAGRSQLLLLSQLGAQTRPAVLDALNSGLSFLSYVGHGGAAVWASENVWNSWDAPSLQAQSLQPLLVTMNCLNGYFVAPSYESLSESLLKAEGRGAIAAFSPSGLSLDGPAHQYHRALMAELTSGRHHRLGDAVLAAQQAYAQTGLMPELLSVYHLLGDPAMTIR